MTAFDRLTGAVQYQILNTLGFRQLRPVQEQSIDAILDGKNCVVLAPTAGGKTEAAFFPILSAMDAGDWKPVSVLYLSPIRALLNNQEPRISRYAETIGRRVFKWHGDTTPGPRKAFLKDPTDILLTTPESLEAMLMSPNVSAARLFAGLRAVIIDEIHAFAGEDRGSHLASVLERLSRFGGSDVQRIGLSATVGNPEEILRWVQGRSTRPAIVVDPKGAKAQPDLKLDYVANLENAARVIAKLHPGKKRLVFVDSRRGAEEVANQLRQLEVETYITHASLAQSERRDAETAFAERQNCVIVSTSVLELGIDVGDLDHVIQIDCPSRVASFLQRMGRTGRRAGTSPNCTFLTTKEDTTVQAAALLRLHAAGFVEPVRPSRRAFHMLAHQLMALGIQLDGVRRGEWFSWMEGATPFADITPEERTALVDHMLSNEILADQDGKLWLGPDGEKRYGRMHFSELYAVFSAPRLITVSWGTREVGTVDADFLQVLTSDRPGGAFSLAGRPWQVVHIDWKKGVCVVEPADRAAAARWNGSPRFLGREITQAIRGVLTTDTVDASWSMRAREVIVTQRAMHVFLQDEVSPITNEGEGLTWWNYAGGLANVLLARLIESELGGKCVVRNSSITCKEEAGQSVVAVRDVIRKLAEAGRPNRTDAVRFAQACMGKQRLSKFQPCLPEWQLDEFLADAIDWQGAGLAVQAAATASGTDMPFTRPLVAGSGEGIMLAAPAAVAEPTASRTGTKLRCLSVTQPWAHFICSGAKDVENRSWNTTYRGPLLIHAGKRMTVEDYECATRYLISIGIKANDIPSTDALERGGLVGAVELVDVLPPGDSGYRWHMKPEETEKPSFGFLLARPVVIPFRAVRGALGFFEVELTAEEEHLVRAAGLLR